MGLIASALSGVGSGHEVDRPEVTFPVGFGPENFLVTSVRASPSFIALPDLLAGDRRDVILAGMVTLSGIVQCPTGPDGSSGAALHPTRSLS